MTESVTESDSSFFVSDDKANDSTDDKVGRNTTAAKKRFANEVSCNNLPLRAKLIILSNHFGLMRMNPRVNGQLV